MELFQTSVLNKYLAEQNKDLLITQYNIFKNYFLNATIQNNIIAQKEEQFQEGFLRELFVKVLGYTINPEPDFNLTTELKNVKDAKKADGAIINNETVLAVIELKGTDTTNLTKIEQQAFNYKNNQDGCRYIITSNFQKLRFYIDNAIEYIEWDLFKLDIEGFRMLYLCLAQTNIFNDLPAKIKTESVTVEEQVTKQLYKEYSQFRKSLFTNIVALNTNYNKLELFKKTQKLLDRFLFLFFAEDRLLVPPNSVRMILDQWTNLKDMDAYVPLYERFKLYFGYLNNGHKGKLHDIFAYNGGLFAPDAILDNITIDDAILYNATLGLSNYDYNSEVDVNILGHIFEHSLTEIEELEQQITKNEIANSKEKGTTKRKKDGVFYTPKYITKYIVENTIGTLCKNKKEELNLQEEDYHKLTKKAKKLLYDNLMQYREWLLHITIIDPACGSGAFLNQALEFLIAEHRWLAELEANIFNAPIVFDVESSILENNLFGVDINEESVEIAKLSLWLRTAKKGRKLNSLNNNIKCGNSLIDDPAVAGDKAFNWQKQFPHIFDKGGFDVVIGNPPYVDMRGMQTYHIVYFKSKFITASDRINLFGLFVEQAINLMKVKSLYGMIIHRNLIRSNEYEKCREMILNFTKVNSVLSFKNGVFQDVTGEMTVLTFEKNDNDNNNNEILIENYELDLNEKINKTTIKQIIFKKCLGKRFNVYITKEKSDILLKIENEYLKLGQISNTLQGIIAGDEKKYISKINSLPEHRPIIRGRDIDKYTSFTPYEYIFFIEGTKVLTRSRKIENFEVESKILTQHVSGRIKAYLDNESLYYMQTINGTIITDKKYSEKFILTILNSKLINFYYENVFNLGAEFTTAVAIENLDLLPIKITTKENQQPFISKADKMLTKNKELQQSNSQFQKLLISKFENLNINTKLEKWYELSFADFNKELIKQKIKLSLSEQSEWLSFFEQEKQKALAIKTEIDKTDREIDQMVYALYGLTDEEIKIVEAV